MLKKLLLLTITSLFIVVSLEAKIIHKERSLYRNMVVTESNQERCLVFTVKRRAKARQSCMDLNNPDRLVFRYAQVAMTSFALQAEPETILVIGLGGGTLPNAYKVLLPEAEVTSVEIDPAVIKVAKEYFAYEESEKLKTIKKDARVFVKQQLREETKYDLIILDAFNGDYIPEHLMTQEFLQEVKGLMHAESVLVSNTFSSSSLYDHESQTYQAVFGDFYNLKIPNSNRIIIALNKELPDYKSLIDNAQSLEYDFDQFNVSLLDNISLIEPGKDWNTKARVLTDQFSPANLLQGRD